MKYARNEVTCITPVQELPEVLVQLQGDALVHLVLGQKCSRSRGECLESSTQEVEL